MFDLRPFLISARVTMFCVLQAYRVTLYDGCLSSF